MRAICIGNRDGKSRVQVRVKPAEDRRPELGIGLGLSGFGVGAWAWVSSRCIAVLKMWRCGCGPVTAKEGVNGCQV